MSQISEDEVRRRMRHAATVLLAESDLVLQECGTTVTVGALLTASAHVAQAGGMSADLFSRLVELMLNEHCKAGEP